MTKFCVEYKEGFDSQTANPILKLKYINAESMKFENGALVFYNVSGKLIYVFNMDVYVRAWSCAEFEE